MTHHIDPHNALVEFLTAFCRYLLAAGVSVSQFNSAAQVAFLRAAATEARFGNAKVNQSAVAAMTGLTRSQVRTMLRTPASVAPRQSSRVQQLVQGWLSDPVFTTASGNARVLQSRGRGRSFAALVKKYGGDVTPRALQAELLRQGFITVQGSRVALSNNARRTREPAALNQLALAMARLIRGPVASPLRLIGAQATYETPVGAGRILIQRRLHQGLKAFAADVEAAGSAIARASPRKGLSRRRMSRTNILLVSQD